MILKQDGPAESTCYSWSPDQKTLGILDWGHTARKEHPLHKALLSIIYTEKNDKVTSYECDKHKYESLAIDPSAGLVAMTYRCEHDTDKRKLVIKNLHTGDEQTFDIPQHFKMPNVSQDPTIAFNKDGNAVVVIENIHVVKTYEEDATVEFGKRQDWRQLYKIFPVPVAMLIGAKNAKESTT